MSWRQKFNLSELHVRDENSSVPYTTSFPNGLGQIRQPPHGPDPFLWAELFDGRPFPHGHVQDPRESDTSPYKEGLLYDPSASDWLSQSKIPRSNHDQPIPTIPPFPAKHSSLKIKSKHGQGSLSPIRRRGQRKAYQLSPLICKWAGCDRPGSFACKATLMRHVETQHVAPHSIPCLDQTCDKSFSRKDNMVMHYRSIHGDDV